MCSENGKLHRETIKRTVERVIPAVEVDVTQVLTPEESALLREKTIERIEAQKMAKEHGRDGLRQMLKTSVERVMSVIHK